MRLLGRARESFDARSVARSAETSAKDFRALAAHADSLVRRAVAANAAAPAAALERLARDDDPQVRVLVAENPSATATALRKVVESSAGGGFAGIARRKALLAVAAHQNATADLLRLLTNDEDRLVARRAEARA